MTTAYQPHGDTSKAAAEKVAGVKQTAKMRVLAFVERCGSRGATDEEIIFAIGGRMSLNTPRARRVELWREGLVKDSGTTRKTRSGCAAVVWVAVTEDEQMEMF